MGLLLWTTIFLLGVSCQRGAANDYYYDEEEEEHAPRPEFITHSQTFRVRPGETVSMPCKTRNLGPYVILWRNGTNVLSANQMVVTPDKRVKLIDGYTLQVRRVKQKDAGEYFCSISTLGAPLDLKHKLEILVPPAVHSTPSDGRITIKKGDTATMECNASGNPTPKISWRRKNNILPSGELSVEGLSITIENADRYHSGVYQCKAVNGVGQPSAAEFHLKVLYSPEIEVEKGWVHSSEGTEAELVCIVHAEPKPNVLWYRNTLRIDPTERVLIETRGNRHTLILRDVKVEDFGQYTCGADNSQGRAKAYIDISGKPDRARFASDPVGMYKDSYNISWSVNSYSPIQQFKLLFRKQQGNDTYRRYSDWSNVIIPGDGLSSFSHFQSYYITGLEPDNRYEAVVQAKNIYGWNEESEYFQFFTRDKDAVEELSPNPGVMAEPEPQDSGLVTGSAYRTAAAVGAIQLSLLACATRSIL